MTNLTTVQGGDFLAHITQSPSFGRGGAVKVDRGATAEMSRTLSFDSTVNIATFSDEENEPRLYRWARKRTSPHTGAPALEKAYSAVVRWLADFSVKDLERLSTSMAVSGQSGETFNVSAPLVLQEQANLALYGVAWRHKSAAFSLRQLDREMAGIFALDQALEELAEVDAYAAEHDLPLPSPKAKETAQGILEKIAQAVPRDYAVSPWDEGAVVVYSSGGKGRRVSIYCNAKGDASYYIIRPNGQSDRGGIRPVRKLPFDLIFGALQELDSLPE